MSTLHLDMTLDAGLSEWIADFLRHRPGVPRRPGTQPPPPPLELPPAAVANDYPEIVLTPVPPRPSRPIPEGWQGRFHSRKLDQTLRWKSQLVFELFQHFEADHRISHFEFRPLRLELAAQEGRKSYTPDVGAVIEGATWFIEVAWSTRLTPAALKRFRQFGEALSRDGFGFQLITETQIRHEPRWGNIRRIIRALPSADPPADRRLRCLEHLGAAPATLDELRASDADVSLKDLMRLTLLGDIAFDIDQPFVGSTVFWARQAATT